jgi:hypothetical protein
VWQVTYLVRLAQTEPQQMGTIRHGLGCNSCRCNFHDSQLSRFTRAEQIGLVHLNARATASLTEADAKSIAGAWNVVVHP